MSRRSMRIPADDRLAPPSREDQLAGVPLFDPAAWPERPQVTPAEHRRLPLGDSLEERYGRWRTTEHGQAVYHQIRAIALGRYRSGAAVVRVKAIVEDELRKRKVSVNNSYLSPIARELCDEYPELLSVIELRERPGNHGEVA